MERRWSTGLLAAAILACSAGAGQAVAQGWGMGQPMPMAPCPHKDEAIVILSKDPFCAAHHLSGDACAATWKSYWFETAQYNGFLEGCRMRHWPEHKT